MGNRRLFYFFILLLVSCQSKSRWSGTAKEVDGTTIRDGNVSLRIVEKGFKFGFHKRDGSVQVPPHAVSGLFLEGRPTEVQKSMGTDREKVFFVSNSDGDRAKVTVSFENGVAVFRIAPENNGPATISLNLGAMPVAHGLGDAAAYGEAFNIVANKESTYAMENDGGGKRWASTFAIFPQNNFAGVFFDKGKKTVTLSGKEYTMNIVKGGEVTFYYFLGDPKTIYSNYKRVREMEGYKDIEPKFRLFELGWESWDALGWNTNQETVREILEKFHRNNYPIRWAVTGSGFWDQGGTTTSFGRWGKKFSEAESFKNWMRQQNIRWMIGLRTNFIPEGGPYYPKTKKRDKNLKVDSFYGNELSSEAKEKGYLVVQGNGKTLSMTSEIFPIVPSNLLDGNAPGAAQWYYKQYKKWGVDGIKEDTMMKLDSLITIYNEPISEIATKGDLVMARNGAFTAPGTLLRINDTGVGSMAKRIPINYLQYAASGFPNVYSDVAAVHNMDNVNELDKNIRHTWLLSLTAGLAVGAYPDRWPKEKQATFKKAIDFHYALAPYLFSAASDGFRTGYPLTLTPLTIAFPEDKVVANLANFQWMVGESLLAAPLLKNGKTDDMDIYLPEGVWYDFESGRKYAGPTMLKDFKMPLDKTPCFVGGQGIVVLREADNLPLKARVYPIAEEKTSLSFTHPDGIAKSLISYKKWNIDTKLVVMDATIYEKVPFKIDSASGSISFEIIPDHNYNIIEE